MATAKICDRCGNVYGKNTVLESFDEKSYGTMRGVCVMFEETDRFRKPDPLAKYKSPNDETCPDRKNYYMDMCDDCCNQISQFIRNKAARVVCEPSVIPR